MSESMGSKISDIIILLSLPHSIRERMNYDVYRFVKRIMMAANTPHIWGVIFFDPHL
jgi:hypothetical protein